MGCGRTGGLYIVVDYFAYLYTNQIKILLLRCGSAKLINNNYSLLPTVRAPAVAEMLIVAAIIITKAFSL